MRSSPYVRPSQKTKNDQTGKNSEQKNDLEKEHITIVSGHDTNTIISDSEIILEPEIIDEDSLDFATAIPEIQEEAITESPRLDSLYSSLPETSLVLASPIKFLVPHSMVRIAMYQKKKKFTLYTLGTVKITAHRKKGSFTCRGRISAFSLKKRGSRSKIRLEAGDCSFEILLPCTLMAQSPQNFIEMDEHSYRGSVIFAPEKGGTFTVVNYLSVEDYLCGVVPFEIGKRKAVDREAVKAQAIAARTYTYKKIVARMDATFDMYATVKDQVYGGVTAEYPLSNLAISMTQNEVMVYKNNLIYAYYHSTCGGMTARIEDVWGWGAQPYLVSIKDCDKNGRSYCSISNYYTWNESWKTSTLSSIMQRFSRQAFPNKPFLKGSLKNIRVLKKYSCGRISVCEMNTSNNTYIYGNDKIRFLMRRNSADYPILRSANFSVLKVNSKQIRISGRGYGHGIGMCQMGALGRARAGQTCKEILSAYYTGVDIVKVTMKK